MIIDEYVTGKDLEGNVLGLIDAISLHLGY
jgi:hypothetical protein